MMDNRTDFSTDSGLLTQKMPGAATPSPRSLRRGFQTLISCLSVLILICLILLSIAQAAQVELAWDPSPSPDMAGYKVYYGAASSYCLQDVDVGLATGCVISGLQENQTYVFKVTAYNTSGIESNFSNQVTYMVNPSSSSQLTHAKTDDEDEEEDEDEDKGGCFIAAVYANENTTEVRVLRNFRDSSLSTNWVGKAIIGAYYELSPPFAKYLKRKEALASLTRGLLTPVVFGAMHPKLLTVLGMGCLAVAFGCLIRGRTRRGEKQQKIARR